MKIAIRILRFFLLAFVFIIIGLPTIGYVVLSTEWAQSRLKDAAVEGLTSLLGTEVKIDKLAFTPFNRLVLNGVSVADDYGEVALLAKEIDARIELSDLIFSGKIIIDYAVIDSMDLHLYKLTSQDELNIAGIISRFKKDEEKKEPTKFNLRLNNVEISHSNLKYDIVDAPETPDRFNPSHIALLDFNLNVFAPLISEKEYHVEIENLSFKEQSGFTVDDFDANVEIDDHMVSVDDFIFKLPNSVLSIDDLHIDIQQLSDIAKIGTSIPAELNILEGTSFYLPDFRAFFPPLGKLDETINLHAELAGTLDNLNVKTIKVNDDNRRLDLTVSGLLSDITHKDQANTTGIDVKAHVATSLANAVISALDLRLPPIATRILKSTPNADLTCKYKGGIEAGDYDVKLLTGIGNIDAFGDYSKAGHSLNLNAELLLQDLNLNLLTNNSQLGELSGKILASGSLRGRKAIGSVDFDFDEFQFKGYTYEEIYGSINASDSLLDVNLNIADPNLDLMLNGEAKVRNGFYSANLVGNAYNIDLDELHLTNGEKGYIVSADINAKASFKDLSCFAGDIEFHNLHISNAEEQEYDLKLIDLEADCIGRFNTLTIKSDILNGGIEGRYDFSTIGNLAKQISMNVFPTLRKDNVTENVEIDLSDNKNEFTYDFRISKAESAYKFFHLPVNIIDPVIISGEVSADRQYASLSVDAPWLLQGNQLIDNTLVVAYADGINRNASSFITSHMPTKKGPMDLMANLQVNDGKLFTDISWQLERDIPINGSFDFVTEMEYNLDNALVTTVTFNPGEINFGSDVWKIHPAKIVYADNSLEVDNLILEAATQSISISGKASQSENDVLAVSLNKINLIDIFETLDIDKALICGQATGDVFGSKLFSKEPELYCNNLFVKDIGYNKCVFGDGDIKLNYDLEESAFVFDADIVNPKKQLTKIKGKIKPATEEMDFLFDANGVGAKFLQPFMAAFCSEIDGILTGRAHLFGTFKYCDLEGEVQADSLSMKIDFTNTTYYTNTTVKINPGEINLNDITLKDRDGHTAKLNGSVKHTYFNDPIFDFNITDAKDFLCYDQREGYNLRWWGTVYGNGSVSVHGDSKAVAIVANMSTAPKSTFTFQLLKSEDAQEFSFITFNDVTPIEITDSILGVSIESESERRIRESKVNDVQNDPTAYSIELNMDINNNAAITLVMDPQGGDMIKAQGNGELQLAYRSLNEDIWMLGTYTLEKGTYNFTFQNIIIKDFKIRDGSSITFTGNPYQGILNIDAIYSTNANLSDLDESFLNDKDLNRTNVPVYAVMKVKGNMMQPDIDFDLEFPSLNQDVYRKVRSIISTDDMMNQQIIYLLALNRFYTPEYMSSTTKGSELFSVASSTISSQLSNMLGKLSENWSIAPNLRSDQGDFSDIEVDVNLSSSLLNNRLLFNGNFGYRDKSMNNNQFIGDFDIEYLLNRSGTFRLKAYNRCNDQNYYLRNAKTTQGVGVMYRMDFDNLFGRRRKKTEKHEAVKEVPDTLIITPADSIK